MEIQDINQCQSRPTWRAISPRRHNDT